MARKPTIKMRKFAKGVVKTGNGTKTALQVYDTDDENTAAVIASENLRKPQVIALIEEQAEIAMLDNIEIRQELKESKKDYNVRFNVNKDVLDRAGFKPPEKNINTNINFGVIVLPELNG